MNATKNTEISIIKKHILKTLKNIGASAQKIILFGSRARQDFTRFSDYDILIITDRKFGINDKIPHSADTSNTNTFSHNLRLKVPISFCVFL